MKPIIIISFIPMIIFGSVKKASDNFIKEEMKKTSISTYKTGSKDFRNLAKIKMSEAISIAQKKSTGRLVESALESENNVLIYCITFSESDKSISEIKIDAATGNILNIENQILTE